MLSAKKKYYRLLLWQFYWVQLIENDRDAAKQEARSHIWGNTLTFQNQAWYMHSGPYSEGSPQKILCDLTPVGCRNKQKYILENCLVFAFKNRLT